MPTDLIEAGAVWAEFSSFPFTGDLVSLKAGGNVKGPGFDRLDRISFGLFFPSYLPRVELESGFDRSTCSLFSSSLTPGSAEGSCRVA